MSGKVNRGLLAASMLVTIAAAPMAHAVSDEVAVQLLERLGELESEVSNLRGENETLRNELQGVKATQREGFLEVDERVSGLEKPATSSIEAVGTVSVETAPASGSITGSIELPALEDPVQQQELQPAAVTLPMDVNSSLGAASTIDPPVSNPEDRKAVAPAVQFNTGGAGNTAGKVDSDSPESYYYYGTEDKNRDKAVEATSVAAPVASSASTASASVPSAHKAKAEYNQAYKALVNNPASAVSAFRAFLSKYPDHELAANAQYWLGEALYAQKDYSGATKEFMVVLKNHKSSPKAPGAALKLGYSFYELRQWDFARRTLEDTIRFFPDSNAAGLAKQRLEKISAEGH